MNDQTRPRPTCSVEIANDGRIEVRGELSFATVPGVRADALRLFSKVRSVHVDLAGVTGADSAGLALLIEWMRESRRLQHNAHFSHVPDALRVIAELSDVDDLLPA